jgi:plastocyanin
VRLRLLPTVLLTAPLLLVLVACTPAATPVPATPTPGPTPAAAIACANGVADVTASIVDFGYTPAQASARVGQTIQWTNDGQAAHTVTFDDGPDCGSVSSGGTLTATFNQAGTYAYHCTFHTDMRATVEVSQ